LFQDVPGLGRFPASVVSWPGMRMSTSFDELRNCQSGGVTGSPLNKLQSGRALEFCLHTTTVQCWSQRHAWLVLLVIGFCIAPGRAERPLGDDTVDEAVLRNLADHLQHSKDWNRKGSNARSHIDSAAKQSAASAHHRGRAINTTQIDMRSAGVKNIRSHAAAMTASGTILRTRHAEGDTAAGNDKSTSDSSNTTHGQANVSKVSAARRSPSDTQASDMDDPSLVAQMGGALGAVGQPQVSNGTLDVQLALDGDLVANVDNEKDVGIVGTLMALVGGTGATIGGTGNLELDQDLVRRMRYQDKAVMLLLLVMYFVTLGFSASFAYRQALNDSPVTFYADPRYHDMVSEGHDVDAFLEAFNQSPKDVQLQVTGFVPVPPGVVGSIEWQGEYYYDAFSFALDLSPWVVREGTSYSSESEGAAGHESRIAGERLIEGIVAQDLEELRDHICHDSNDLSIVDLRKEVSWPNWEELATNIKHRIRQSGFNGIITVRRTESDSVSIYKNTPWANFMHSRTTKVLCALSVLGWMFYLPYMWLRCSSSCIRSRYVIDVSIDIYWQLIADKLSADGFSEDRSRDPTGPDAAVGESIAFATAATQGIWIPQSEFVRFNSISLGDASSLGTEESAVI